MEWVLGQVETPTRLANALLHAWPRPTPATYMRILVCASIQQGLNDQCVPLHACVVQRCELPLSMGTGVGPSLQKGLHDLSGATQASKVQSRALAGVTRV